MHRWNRVTFVGAVALAMAAATGIAQTGEEYVLQGAAEPEEARHEGPVSHRDAANLRAALSEIRRGKQAFRHDTMGNQAFWGGALHLHEAIAGKANGGTGPGLDPETALGLGLKVDVRALPNSLKAALAAGQVDLSDPATTLALLELDAVVGVRGFFGESGRLRSVGITCALCHSDVDDSFAPGIGERLDGWAARDLDVGAIIALAPNVQPLVDLLRLVDPAVDAAAVRAVLRSWGPGKFDAELLMDGKAFRPDGRSAATLIPPAFGLAGVNLHTWTGWGSVTHWNGFVANLEMQGRGTFYDPRLNDPLKFPIAALAGFGDVRNDPDLVTAKLARLHLYQLSLPAPEAPRSGYNAARAARGEALFRGKADCARCHVPPLFTEPGWNMHTPEEIGIDSFQAERSPDGRYRTAPLKGLWTHGTGGYYHDGRFANLRQVVKHYDSFFVLGLSEEETTDLVHYLRSS
ncbi:MAG TPA: hypothetical protein VFY03_07750 [Woeseiaceae bacterium]|nr:hypothetical protein [Woeseiaceae bacterium]